MGNEMSFDEIDKKLYKTRSHLKLKEQLQMNDLELFSEVEKSEKEIEKLLLRRHSYFNGTLPFVKIFRSKDRRRKKKKSELEVLVDRPVVIKKTKCKVGDKKRKFRNIQVIPKGVIQFEKNESENGYIIIRCFSKISVLNLSTWEISKLKVYAKIDKISSCKFVPPHWLFIEGLLVILEDDESDGDIGFDSDDLESFFLYNLVNKEVVMIDEVSDEEPLVDFDIISFSSFICSNKFGIYVFSMRKDQNYFFEDEDEDVKCIKVIDGVRHLSPYMKIIPKINRKINNFKTVLFTFYEKRKWIVSCYDGRCSKDLNKVFVLIHSLQAREFLRQIELTKVIPDLGRHEMKRISVIYDTELKRDILMIITARHLFLIDLSKLFLRYVYNLEGDGVKFVNYNSRYLLFWKSSGVTDVLNFVDLVKGTKIAYDYSGKDGCRNVILCGKDSIILQSRSCIKLFSIENHEVLGERFYRNWYKGDINFDLLQRDLIERIEYLTEDYFDVLEEILENDKSGNYIKLTVSNFNDNPFPKFLLFQE